MVETVAWFAIKKLCKLVRDFGGGGGHSGGMSESHTETNRSGVRCDFSGWGGIVTTPYTENAPERLTEPNKKESLRGDPRTQRKPPPTWRGLFVIRINTGRQKTVQWLQGILFGSLSTIHGFLYS